jgi:hypothetical protein
MTPPPPGQDQAVAEIGAQRPLEAGDRAETRFRGKSKWFKGRILKSHGDGTFDVRYDDGDRETNVNADLIQSLEMPKRSDDDQVQDYASAKLVYTLALEGKHECTHVLSFTPSSGGAPRLVLGMMDDDDYPFLAVYDTGSGAFLGTVEAPEREPRQGVCSLISYQQPSNGLVCLVAGFGNGRVFVWNGNDRSLLRIIWTNQVDHLAMYEDPGSGKARLVSG